MQAVEYDSEWLPRHVSGGKRFGIGYTLNLGNHWSWVVLLLVLVPAALGLIFLR